MISLTNLWCISLGCGVSSMWVQARLKNSENCRVVSLDLSRLCKTCNSCHNPGKVVLDGRSLAVNPDFAQQAIFLAQQLKCSEKYIASILHQVMIENPNVDSVMVMEATIVEFHKRRRHLIDCLRYLVESAEVAESSGAPRLYVRLEAFVRHELVPAAQTGNDESLAHRVFVAIEALGSTVAEAYTAKQNATSTTTPPGAGKIFSCTAVSVLDFLYRESGQTRL